jgi:hypothetical protein
VLQATLVELSSSRNETLKLGSDFKFFALSLNRRISLSAIPARVRKACSVLRVINKDPGPRLSKFEPFTARGHFIEQTFVQGSYVQLVSQSLRVVSGTSKLFTQRNLWPGNRNCVEGPAPPPPAHQRAVVVKKVQHMRVHNIDIQIPWTPAAEVEWGKGSPFESSVSFQNEGPDLVYRGWPSFIETIASECECHEFSPRELCFKQRQLTVVQVDGGTRRFLGH